MLTSHHGKGIQIRALVDPAAETSFISEKVLQALSLPKTPTHTTISGVGAGISATASYITSLVLRSRVCDSFNLPFSATVLPRLTQLLPRRVISDATWNYLDELQLADPEFYAPAPVDCILGGELYPALLLDGVRRGPSNTPVAQKTKLGWILTGPTGEVSNSVSAFSVMLAETTTPSISDLLRKFWEIEDLPPTATKTPDDNACENFFKDSHYRDETGRYVVRLPFRNPPRLFDTYQPALRRLLSMERKLGKDEELRSEYVKFLHCYEHLQHMVEVPGQSENQVPSCFLPHHAVLKQDGTRKLRVVFDASQSSASGQSLNAFLHTGPRLQLNITTVLTRWRTFRYVFTADIVKMFRQILVHPEDRRWQQILWRDSPDTAIKVYQLCTVTYGTACAPQLATKVLRQLADDEGARFPKGANVLRAHMYVDDALAGGGMTLTRRNV